MKSKEEKRKGGRDDGGVMVRDERMRNNVRGREVIRGM
jgi:hypothetical protein